MNPISFNFPTKPIKQRKTRSDKGTMTCIWCGNRVHEWSEIHIFQRKDCEGKEHHLGYVFDKKDMYDDERFAEYVGIGNLCEECQEVLNG